MGLLSKALESVEEEKGGLLRKAMSLTDTFEGEEAGGLLAKAMRFTGEEEPSVPVGPRKIPAEKKAVRERAARTKRLPRKKAAPKKKAASPRVRKSAARAPAARVPSAKADNKRGLLKKAISFSVGEREAPVITEALAGETAAATGEERFEKKGLLRRAEELAGVPAAESVEERVVMPVEEIEAAEGATGAKEFPIEALPELEGIVEPGIETMPLPPEEVTEVGVMPLEQAISELEELAEEKKPAPRRAPRRRAAELRRAVRRAPKPAVRKAALKARKPKLARAGRGAPVSFSEAVEKRLKVRDHTALNDIFVRAIRERGYAYFVDELLGVMARLGGGKGALLFSLSRDAYTPAAAVREKAGEKKPHRYRISRSSKLVQMLRDEGVFAMRAGARKIKDIQKEAKALAPAAPWTAVALAAGDSLPAFALIGSQSKRARIAEDSLKLLAQLASPHVVMHMLTRKHRETVDALDKKLAEARGIVSLHESAGRARGEISGIPIAHAFEELCSHLGAGAAALFARAWKKSAYEMVASVGLPERVLSHYRIAGNDRGINSIAKSGEPAVAPEVEKRVAQLSKGTEGLIDTCIVAPVVFGKEVLGILNVHSMEGAGRTLSGEVRSKLAHAAMSLVPALMDIRFDRVEPAEILERAVSSELENAKKGKYPLAAVFLTFEQTWSVSGLPGISKQMRLYMERLRRVSAELIGGKGRILDLSWSGFLFFIKESERGEAEVIVGDLRDRFYVYAKKLDRKAIPLLTARVIRYPAECRNTSELLAAFY